MAEWVDELTLVKLTEPDKRVNSNGFAEQGEESNVFSRCLRALPVISGFNLLQCVAKLFTAVLVKSISYTPPL